MVPLKQRFQEIIEVLSDDLPLTEKQAQAYLLLDLMEGLDKIQVLLNERHPVPAHWPAVLAALAQGQPVQYVAGAAYFAGLRLGLNASTLIPRPETEELLLHGLELLSDQGPLRVLDVGTGSGALAIAWALKRPQDQVLAWDISPSAIQQAQVNAQSLGANVSFEVVDLYQAPVAAAHWDLILSNPPYVLEEEKVDMLPQVKDFEPALALFVSNEAPLAPYQALSNLALAQLKPGGWMAWEINARLGKECVQILLDLNFSQVQLRQDFLGRDRFVWGRKPSRP